MRLFFKCFSIATTLLLLSCLEDKVEEPNKSPSAPSPPSENVELHPKPVIRLLTKKSFNFGDSRGDNSYAYSIVNNTDIQPDVVPISVKNYDKSMGITVAISSNYNSDDWHIGVVEQSAKISHVVETLETNEDLYQVNIQDSYDYYDESRFKDNLMYGSTVNFTVTVHDLNNKSFSKDMVYSFREKCIDGRPQDCARYVDENSGNLTLQDSSRNFLTDYFSIGNNSTSFVKIAQDTPVYTDAGVVDSYQKIIGSNGYNFYISPSDGEINFVTLDWRRNVGLANYKRTGVRIIYLFSIRIHCISSWSTRYWKVSR